MQVAVSLDRAALLGRLAELDDTLALACHSKASLDISIATRALRCGKQVRMVLGEATAPPARRTLPSSPFSLDAHRWFEDLRTGRVESIAALAKRDGQQVTHVSRTISLAFLAPDIVDMILSGAQPITLTPERLKPRRPLPLDWQDHGRLLLC